MLNLNRQVDVLHAFIKVDLYFFSQSKSNNTAKMYVSHLQVVCLICHGRYLPHHQSGQHEQQTSGFNWSPESFAHWLVNGWQQPTGPVHDYEPNKATAVLVEQFNVAGLALRTAGASGR